MVIFSLNVKVRAAIWNLRVIDICYCIQQYYHKNTLLYIKESYFHFVAILLVLQVITS